MADRPEKPSRRPLSRKEIAQLSRWAQVALAARCAFRVMPAMAVPGGFRFVGGEPQEHVDAIEMAATAAALSAVAGSVHPAVPAASAAARAAADADAD